MNKRVTLFIAFTVAIGFTAMHFIGSLQRYQKWSSVPLPPPPPHPDSKNRTNHSEPRPEPETEHGIITSTLGSESDSLNGSCKPRDQIVLLRHIRQGVARCSL
ncbi:uncharacterized protein [Amphiura filiformis]|uniref:uncharacterized protein isoform X1 n=1 Tax=Amphiura filiformis TaxID=82378 RepID=UPI003B226463